MASAALIMCRYGEKITRMTRGGGESTCEELFTYACPKFITAAPPSLDAPTANTNQVLGRSMLAVDVSDQTLNFFSQSLIGVHI